MACRQGFQRSWHENCIFVGCRILNMKAAYLLINLLTLVFPVLVWIFSKKGTFPALPQIPGSGLNPVQPGICALGSFFCVAGSMVFQS